MMPSVLPVFDDLYNAAEDLLGRNLGPGRRDRVAFIDRDGQWSFAALADRAARVAAVLDGLGVAAEQRVALVLLDTIDFPAAFLGAIQHGAVPVPMSTRLTPKDYAWMLADSRARVLVVSEALLPILEPVLAEIPTLAHVIVSGGSGPRPTLAAALEAVRPAPGFAATRRGDVAFWLYTSGTTGRPKAAVHAHEHLVATAEHYAGHVLGIAGDDVVFSAAKLFFAYGLGNGLTFPLAVGATAVLLDALPSVEAVAEILREHRPTLFFGVPTLYGMLLAHAARLPGRDELRLRACVSAGEALPPALLERWRERTGVDILDGIGSTEALHIFVSNRIGAVRPGTSGTPVPGYEVRLLDEAGREVAPGEVGDLEVSGPSCAMMYWNQRAASKRTFRGAWMRTGDKYRQDAEGSFVYEGRSDDLIKVGGIWVSPFEVESALLEHPAVLECAVIGHPDADALVKPRAFVVLREGHGAGDDLAAELQAFVRERLAPYKRPRWVSFVGELPKTATGKIQRFALREPGLAEGG